MVTIDQVEARTVPLIFGYGGGVNSMAGLIALFRRRVRPDLILFADTRGEKPGTYSYRRDVADPWCLTHQFPEITEVVKASPRTGDRSLEDECLRRETMPSRAFGLSSCAHRWKIEPQEKFLNHWPPAVGAWARGEKPIKVIGYDAGEDHREKIPEDAKLRYWYPLVEFGLDREDCEKLIVSAGLALPPKSACFFCPSSTKSEVIGLAGEHPDLAARAVKMEKIALTSERHNLRNIKGLGRHWAWGDLLRMTEDDRASLPEAPVEPCTICVAGS